MRNIFLSSLYARLTFSLTLLASATSFGAIFDPVPFTGSVGSGSVNAVFVQGVRVYFGEGAHLSTADISDPLHPQFLGSIEVPEIVEDIAVTGSIALVADGTSGVLVIDVSNPGHPSLTGSFATLQPANRVAMNGHIGYVPDGSKVNVIDLTNTAVPDLVATFTADSDVLGIKLSGDLLFLSLGVFGFEIVNVSDPALPSFIGEYNTSGVAQSVTVSGGIAYVADGAAGLAIVNVADPTFPGLRGEYDTPGITSDAALLHALAIVADGNVDLLAVNVSDPANAFEIASYHTPGHTVRVATSDSFIYLADADGGFLILHYLGTIPDFTPSPTPSPSVTPSPTPSVSPTESLTPSPTETPTPAPSLTETPTAAATETSAPTVSPSATPEFTLTPTPISGYDSSILISVSIPNEIPVDHLVLCRVTLQNAGTSTWTADAGYLLWVFSDPCGLATTTVIPLDRNVSVVPGESYSFRFFLKGTSTPGEVCQIELAPFHVATGFFGDLVTASPKMVNSVNDAQFVSSTLPPQVPPGTSLQIGVTVRNTGNTEWFSEEDYALTVTQDFCGLADSRRTTNLPDDGVFPGTQWQFITPLTAPLQTGVCTIQMQMGEDGLGLFGAPFELTVDVEVPTNAAREWVLYD